MNSAQQAITYASSITRTLVLMAVILGLGVTTAVAQDQEYAQKFDEARQVAQAASQLEGSDVQEAASQYEEAYREAAEAARMAEDEGAVDHADQISEFAARIAYRAGQLLYDNEYIEESMEHFQAGIDIDAGFQANYDGLRAAERSLEQADVVAASEALNAGNPQEAINLLEDADENASVHFFRAEAYIELGQDQQALENAEAALEIGEGLDSERRARLNLIIGEIYLDQGDYDEARPALQNAANEGPPSVRDRAQALLDRI